MSHIASVREEIRKIAPYNSGMTLNEVRAKYSPAVISKLGSNENPLGASQRALAALQGLNDLVHLYPDPQGQELCSAIACSFGTTPDHIVLGNGSEDLIGVICRAVVRPGDTVATLYPSFPLHEDYTVLMGGGVERIAVKADLTINLDHLIDAARRKPRMIMFSNPMNPVGSWLTHSDLARLIEALDGGTIVVVDEAYAEYAKGEDYPSAAHLLRNRMKNWVVLRTFSKAYGLAGLRIGYGAVGDPELCSYLNRARTPFNTNVAAQVAALAALGDADHLARTTALNTSERERVRAGLDRLGYRAAPSRGNFLFFDARESATALSERLLRQGVIVKPWKQPGYESFIRTSIGSAQENDHFLMALSQARDL